MEPQKKFEYVTLLSGMSTTIILVCCPYTTHAYVGVVVVAVVVFFVIHFALDLSNGPSETDTIESQESRDDDEQKAKKGCVSRLIFRV